MLTDNARKELVLPDTPTQVVLALRRRVGLSEADIARATGVAERTVRRWLGGAAITRDNADRLDDLRTVAAELAVAMTAQGIVTWLRNRNRLLDYERPLDLLGDGRFREVMGAVEALRNGEYV